MPIPEKKTPTKVTVKEKNKLVQLVAQRPVLTAATKTIGLPATQPVTETAPVLQVEQRRLPQTNEKKASIFTTLGGTALVFLSGLFIKKKKTDKE
nr:LPXTG cell wall anchor domain-containing protein [Enterococcus hulanensis]